MPTAIILSGAGRYADPWHPFSHTSDRLADLANASGWKTTIADDIDQRLATGLDGIDLLIVNAGDPWRPGADAAEPEPGDPELIAQARISLTAAFVRGVSVLGIHTAAASLRDYPEFRQALGGEWIPGTSWHPPFGPVRIRPLHDQIVEGCCDFTVQDERYTDLTIDPSVEPLAGTVNGESHVLVWAHQHGPSRIVYDALGHDLRSYDSSGHRSLLRRALSWLEPRETFAA